MVNFPKTTDGVTKRFEADARQLVPVNDEFGGTGIYLNGRPAYYVLNGEWFQAVPSHGESKANMDELVRESPPRGLLTNEFMSTS